MSGLFWAIILLLIALVVVALEMFLPSAGLLGLVSGVLIISSIIIAFMHSMGAGVGILLAVALLAPLIFMAFVHVWPNTPIGRRVLIGQINEDDVILSGKHYDEQTNLVGKTGVARSKMIPSGQIVIDSQKYDAVSEGLPIEAGDHVKVVAVKMFKVFVRKIDPNQTATAGTALEDDDILSQPIDDLFDEEN